MKNLTLTGFVISLLCLFVFNATASAQCTPNANACTIENPDLPACIDPDSVEFEKGVAGSKTIQLLLGRTVKTGLPFVPEVYISSMDVTAIERIPAGLSVQIYSANSADPINGKDRGKLTPRDENTPIHLCAVFSGTPASGNLQTDSLEIVADVMIKLMTGGRPTGGEINPNTLQPGTNPFRFRYRVAVKGTVGISEYIQGIGKVDFQVSPNPVENNLYARFNTPIGGDALISITDLSGKVLYSESFNALDAGDHILPVGTADFAPGVYFVHLEAFGKKMTQKMIK